MILNITSYPRSGNSFFSTTLLQFGAKWRTNGHVIEFKPVGHIFESAGVKSSDYGVECVPFGSDPDPEAVYVHKRHDHPDDYPGPRIYLVRDGRDSLYSYAHHHVANRCLATGATDFEISPQMINEEAHRIVLDPNANWGKWVERGLDNPNVVAVVRYEAMKANPLFTAQTALARAGYVVTKVQDPPSWAKLKSGSPHFYWKGRVGGYKDLDPDIIRAFEQRNMHTLKRLHYL